MMYKNSSRLVFDAGGTKIRYGLVDDRGNIDLDSLVSVKSTNRISTAEDFRDLVIDAINHFNLNQSIYVLSIAGPVSYDNKVIRKYTNVLKNQMDIPISDMIATGLRKTTCRNAEVYVIKDATAASLAEMSFAGAASDKDEVLSLILGTGTGGAICRRDNKGLFIFSDDFADLGHHQVDISCTEECNCGGKGCVELQTSGTAVVRKINKLADKDPAYDSSLLLLERELNPGSITGEDIAWAAQRGDSFTDEVLKQSARPLATLLRNVFTSYPHITVVFTGGFALGVGKPLLDKVKNCLKESGIPFSGENLDSIIENNVLLGKISSEHTNLVGAKMFLDQKEIFG